MFLQQHKGLRCHAQQRSRASPMHSPGVPFWEGEHRVSGKEAVPFAVNSLETRYFGSLAPSLCEGSHRSSHKLGSRVQSGLAE